MAAKSNKADALWRRARAFAGGTSKAVGASLGIGIALLSSSLSAQTPTAEYNPPVHVQPEAYSVFEQPAGQTPQAAKPALPKTATPTSTVPLDKAGRIAMMANYMRHQNDSVKAWEQAQVAAAHERRRAIVAQTNQQQAAAGQQGYPQPTAPLQQLTAQQQQQLAAQHQQYIAQQQQIAQQRLLIEQQRLALQQRQPTAGQRAQPQPQPVGLQERLASTFRRAKPNKPAKQPTVASQKQPTIEAPKPVQPIVDESQQQVVELQQQVAELRKQVAKSNRSTKSRRTASAASKKRRFAPSLFDQPNNPAPAEVFASGQQIASVETEAPLELAAPRRSFPQSRDVELVDHAVDSDNDRTTAIVPSFVDNAEKIEADLPSFDFGSIDDSEPTFNDSEILLAAKQEVVGTGVQYVAPPEPPADTRSAPPRQRPRRLASRQDISILDSPEPRRSRTRTRPASRRQELQGSGSKDLPNTKSAKDDLIQGSNKKGSSSRNESELPDRDDERRSLLDDDQNRESEAEARRARSDLESRLDALEDDDDSDIDDIEDEDPNEPPPVFDDRSCQEFRNELLSSSIRDISLDISPRGTYRSQEQPGVFRNWQDGSGNVLGSGTMVDMRRGYVILDSGQKLPYAKLSESDWAAIAEYWLLPSSCSIGSRGTVARNWTPQTVSWNASGLCHKPLYFENIQLERYGHSRGPFLQPVQSTFHFFRSLVFLPYRTAINPPNECQYALGYYRPGNCAPWLIDPIPFSREGIRRQALVTTGLSFIP